MDINYTAPIQSNDPPAIAAIRQLVRSPLFLVLAISCTLNILINFLSTFILLPSLSLLLQAYLAESGLSDDFAYGFMNGFSPAFTGAYTIGIIPTLLIAIGLWLIYATFSAKDGGSPSTAGFTMIKVSTIITFVGICIAIALALVFCIVIFPIVLSSIPEFEEIDMGTVLAAVSSIVLLPISAFLIFYYIKALQTINAIKSTVASGVPTGKISTFVAVMVYIGAFLSIFSLASSLDVFTVLSAVTTIISSICLGKLLFRYRDAMRTLSAPQAATVYEAEFTQE